MDGSAKQDGDAKPIAPLLRWAGGKRRLLTDLMMLLPPDVRSRRYYEPFAGGASLFFALCPESAVLSDANAHLIKCYEFVRDVPQRVAAYLRMHASRTCRDYYYTVRSVYNQRRYSAAQAARFIYLNKTCFNGIFRVNKRGKFNVPYGWKEPPALPDEDALVRASKALKRAKLLAAPFEEILSAPRIGDFVYLDPPYPPLNGSAYFTHYTRGRFGEADQERLAASFCALTKRGCLVMMSNADTSLTRNLYRPFKARHLEVTRYVSCKKQKHRAQELIITNY